MSNVVSTLLGVAVGSLLSLLATWFLRGRESRLRLTEKVLERQIQAHEKAGEIAGLLYHVARIGWYEDSGLDAALPSFLVSWEETRGFMRALDEFCRCHGFWLDARVSWEFGLLWAYFAELERLVSRANTENLWAVGLVLCDDFAEFSRRIRNECYKYLGQRALALHPVRQHIELSDSVAKRRRELLANTILFSRRKYVEEIANTDPQVLRATARFKWTVSEDVIPGARGG